MVELGNLPTTNELSSNQHTLALAASQESTHAGVFAKYANQFELRCMNEFGGLQLFLAELVSMDSVLGKIKAIFRVGDGVRDLAPSPDRFAYDVKTWREQGKFSPGAAIFEIGQQLKDENHWVRAAAVTVLSVGVGVPAVREMLSTQITSDSDLRVVACAVGSVFSQFPYPEVKSALIHAYKRAKQTEREVIEELSQATDQSSDWVVAQKRDILSACSEIIGKVTPLIPA